MDNIDKLIFMCILKIKIFTT